MRIFFFLSQCDVSQSFCDFASLQLRSFLLLQHRYDGLSWGHPIRALFICTAQTLRGCTQAHKTEFGFTPRAHQASTVAFAVFQQHAAVGTSADRGTVVNALHVFEDDVWALRQYVQRTLAAFVVAAVRARAWTFPLIHTLPTKCIILASPFSAHQALHIEVVGVLSAHQTTAARTLERQVMITVTHLLFTTCPAQSLLVRMTRTT